MRNDYKYWTTSEIRYVEDNCCLKTKVIAENLGRSRRCVELFFHRNGISLRKLRYDKQLSGMGNEFTKRKNG